MAISRINWPIVICVCLLAGFGIAMLYSAAGGDWAPWAQRQFVRFLIGFPVMITIALLPMMLLYRYTYLFYLVCVGLLVLVELFGQMGMGAQRWLNIAGVNLQPSEMMKLSLVLALARYYHGMLPEDISRPSRLIPPLVLIAIPVVLILKQPNLGTASITAAMGIMVMFAAGVHWMYFVSAGAAILAAIPVGWHFLHDYQKQRVETFLNPEADPLGAGYNIMQSKIAIGSGGLFGNGFMQGSQSQLDFLPEKQTDFIFTMIAEEFGYIGGGTVIILFLLLITAALVSASNGRNRFGSLIAIGMAALLMLHMTINIGMVMGLLPVVGVPLPLLSYGGTMLIVTMAGFGLLLNSHANRDMPIRHSKLSLV